MEEALVLSTLFVVEVEDDLCLLGEGGPASLCILLGGGWPASVSLCCHIENLKELSI